MDVFECIITRRSVRRYTDKKIPQETLDLLIDYGCRSASASNTQPWGFVIIEGKETIHALSEQVRADLINMKQREPWISVYSRWLENPDFNFFFKQTQTLLLIYGHSHVKFYRESCTLAAANIMLAAHAMGIGSCWIGFAFETFNTAEFKASYNVPEHYDLVTTLTLGYKSDDRLFEMARKPALIFNRQHEDKKWE